MHESICIFAESLHAFAGVVSTMHVQVGTLDMCCEHQIITFAWCSLQDVHMRSCMCSLFHFAFGGVQLVYGSTCCLAWGVIFERRKDREVVVRSSLRFQQNLKQPRNSKLHGIEIHRLSSKGTKLLFQVIKAIINHSNLKTQIQDLSA